jgi:photosystem II stability/assembly factor-like uncharacterized protein
MPTSHIRLLFPLCTALVFAACQGKPVVPSSESPYWEIQYQDSTVNFIGLDVVSDDIVWAAGSGGRWVKSLDGGETWSGGVVPGAEDLQFRDVHAFSGDEVFLLTVGSGTNSRFYRTRDGGRTWTLVFQNEDENAFFDCFSFWSRRYGIAFSDSYEGAFRLMKTSDGGDTWTRLPPDSLPGARDGEGAFASSGTCVVTRPGGLAWFATGASGVDTRVIRTDDFGETWDEAPTPIASTSSSSGIFTLSFLNNRRGVALGGEYTSPDSLVVPNVAVTNDGGITWTIAGQSNLGGSIFGSSYIPGAETPTIVAVAPTGTDMSTDNAMTWTRIDSTNFWSVAFNSPAAGWAAGPGQIARLRYRSR